jgi:predicted negative regulator of RcsB-dependent stress response
VARTKMTRHELKEQDEITTSLQRFTEVAIARKKELIAGSIALAAIVLAFVAWRVYSSNRNAAAQTALSQAINAYTDPNVKVDKDRFTKALAEAQKTHDAYPSLTAGRIALYYVALCQEGLGDTAKATANLEQVIQSGDASIAGVARFALAGIYKTHGDVQKATDLYKQIYDNGGYSKSAAIFELAQLSEASNKIDEAKTYYQKIVSEFPDSPFRQEADQALKRLGVPAA